MNHSNQRIRVFAIHPTRRGFGFTVFEPRAKLIDWGLKEVRHDTNAQCMTLIENLFERYRPDVIVMEDLAAKTARRGPRVRTLLRNVARLASRKQIKCIRFSRSKVMETLPAKLTNKYQVASAIAAQLPELAARLPKPRKSWMPEDPRTSIFSAAAMALRFFSFNLDSDREEIRH